MARAAVERLAASQGDGPLLLAPLDGRGLARLATHPSLVALAAAALDGPVCCFGCTAIVKAPGGASPVLWHADGAPWRARGIEAAVTLWLALDATCPSNGGLRVLAGSQLAAAAAELVPSGRTDDVFGWHAPGPVDERHAVDLRLAVGDISMHGPDLLHASGANRSTRPRRAVALRYRPGISQGPSATSRRGG